MINNGWLFVHLLLGNLFFFSSYWRFCGACEYLMGAMLLPSYKSNHPLLRVCCNPKQTVSTITSSHLQSVHTHRKRGLNSFWKCLRLVIRDSWHFTLLSLISTPDRPCFKIITLSLQRKWMQSKEERKCNKIKITLKTWFATAIQFFSQLLRNITKSCFHQKQSDSMCTLAELGKRSN